MNGGPGCSSMDGFFYEMGPFHFVEPHPKNDTPKLKLNDFAWTKQSNMIFLEAPACVGLSYADTPQGCYNNDTQQAIDNLQALRQWYQGFPEYRSNSLYITGTTSSSSFGIRSALIQCLL
jgi:serine carboxypeptidase-like clade 1